MTLTIEIVAIHCTALTTCYTGLDVMQSVTCRNYQTQGCIIGLQRITKQLNKQIKQKIKFKLLCIFQHGCGAHLIGESLMILVLSYLKSSNAIVLGSFKAACVEVFHTCSACSDVICDF
jgi:hypothetical protein